MFSVWFGLAEGIVAGGGKHGTAAVVAPEEARVDIVVNLYAAVVASASLLAQCAGAGEGTVVDDGLVVILDDDVLAVVLLNFFSVDLGAGIFGLAQGADIKVIIQDTLNGNDGPVGLNLALVGLALRLTPHLLRHTGSGDVLVGKVVCNLLVAPATVIVEIKNFPNDLRLGGDDLELLLGGDTVAVGGGAEPLAVGLTTLDDTPDLAGGVGDGHLVDEELELDLQPVIVVGEVDAITYGDDAHTCVAKILQLRQASTIAASKTGEVLDQEDVELAGHEAPAHFLIALPMAEGVTGTVPILKKSEAAAGEMGLYIVGEDGFLVLDGNIFLIQLIVHGDAAVAGDVEGFSHSNASLGAIDFS